MSRIDGALHPQDASTPHLLYFHAGFHEACAPGGPMDQVLNAVASKHPQVKIVRLDAEQAEDEAEAMNVQVVPTCVVVQGGKIVDRVEGYNPTKLSEVLARLPKSQPLTGVAARVHELAQSSRVFAFVNQDAGALTEHVGKVQHATFNVDTDAEIKAFFAGQPALYISAQRVDWKAMSAQQLDEALQPPALFETTKRPKAQTLEDRLRALVSQDTVMLFMKGTPQQPRCGFSAKIVALLNESGVKYGSFDILSDETVRQGLKTLYEWPTYPQLYAKGKLIGGLDIVKELKDEGSLLESLEA